MNRAIKTETFQPSARNSKRLAKLAEIRGEKAKTINLALDSYFSVAKTPGLPKLVLSILDALERDGASAAEILQARTICEEALGK